MATDPVVLADGLTARVVVPTVHLTSLVVPMVTTSAKVADHQRVVTRVPAAPILTPRDVLVRPPAGSEGGQPVAGAITYVQRFALLTWRWTHPLGRRPQVEVFYGLDENAELADTDVSATATEVVVEWAQPTVGSVVLR